MDYDFAVLDVADEDESARARLRSWLDAVGRGFHDRRSDDAGWKVFLQHAVTDGVVPRGAWLPAGEFGAEGLPVATLSHFDGTLNTGRGLLPLRMVTDVTVSPAHRRQGLFRRLMEDDLADTVASGLPLAALTVSEATIYGRFGFGPASFRRSYEVDTTARFAMTSAPADPGRVELVEPADAWSVMNDVFLRFHESARGSVHRPAFYEPMLTGSHDFDNGGGPDRSSRCVVHLDAAGRPDGYATYKHSGFSERPRTIKVRDLVSLDPPGHLALWRFLGAVDLAERVAWPHAAVDDLLPWALDDINCAKITGEEEHIWLRVLDVPVALEARPWYADAAVVLDVVDPQGHAAGRWRIVAEGGSATVTATDEPAEVSLTADVLGALYLGGVGVPTLHAAGRLTGSAGGVERFAAIADGGPAPYSVTSF